MDDMDLTSAESKATYEQIQNYVLEKSVDYNRVCRHYGYFMWSEQGGYY